jgi:hypothetical protein
MTDVLDTIERELLVAIRRSNARRRRRRTLGIFSGAAFAVALTAGGGVAAITDSPLERLLGGGADPTLGVARDPDGGRSRSDLALTDATGTRWSLTIYRARGGWIITSAVPAGLRARIPDVGGRNAFALAASLIDGPAIGVGLVAARHDGRVGRLLVGQVDAAAREVVVELAGRRYTAALTPGAITAKVERPPEDRLLPQGRALLERIGDAISLRAFAVVLPDDAIAAGERQLGATIETTLDDGTRHVESNSRICASARCGLHTYELPDQGG